MWSAHPQTRHSQYPLLKARGHLRRIDGEIVKPEAQEGRSKPGSSGHDRAACHEFLTAVVVHTGSTQSAFQHGGWEVREPRPLSEELFKVDAF